MINKIIYSALSGALGVILLLVGGWAQSTNSRVTAVETRIGILEQQYARIETQLQDIQIGVTDLRSDAVERKKWQSQVFPKKTH